MGKLATVCPLRGIIMMFGYILAITLYFNIVKIKKCPDRIINNEYNQL